MEFLKVKRFGFSERQGVKVSCLNLKRNHIEEREKSKTEIIKRVLRNLFKGKMANLQMRIDRKQKIIKRVTQKQLSKMIPGSNGNIRIDLPDTGVEVRYAVKISDSGDLLYVALCAN